MDCIEKANSHMQFAILTEHDIEILKALNAPQNAIDKSENIRL
jgi:hypothetical protein